MTSKKRNSGTESEEPRVYQIRIRGHLDGEWADWFDGMAVTLGENGDTLLTGPVADQAALHGLLRRVRDLGVPLLSVACVDADPPDCPGASPEGVKRTTATGEASTDETMTRKE
jgi:hypothetical protein